MFPSRGASMRSETVHQAGQSGRFDRRGASCSCGRSIAFAVIVVMAGAARADIVGFPAFRSSDELELGASDKVREIRQAMEKFGRRDFDGCLGLLKAAAAKHSDLPPAKLILARFFFSAGQLERCRVTLEEAAVDAPAYPGVYLLFGELALAEGRSTDAMVHYEKASLVPSPPWWGRDQERAFELRRRLGWATLSERRGDWPAVKAHLLAYLEREPTDGETRRRLARALIELNDPDGAYRQVQQAAKEDPTSGPAATVMGWTYTQKGDLAKAARWMEYAVKSAPEDPRTHVGYATWLLQHDRPEEARDRSEAAAGLMPRSQNGPAGEAGKLRHLRGLIARHLKEYERAEGHFSAILERFPGRPRGQQPARPGTGGAGGPGQAAACPEAGRRGDEPATRFGRRAGHPGLGLLPTGEGR